VVYKFPPKGAKDNEPTPWAFYNILVKELGYKDVCLGPEKFDALKEIWPTTHTVTLRGAGRTSSWTLPSAPMRQAARC
jgi:hypothetical protein